MSTISAERLRLVVCSTRALTGDVLELVLGRQGGGRLPDWEPGGHVTLELPAGPRQYSLCGDRWDPDHYRIAVLREDAGRGGSRHVHEALVPGSVVTALAPRNHFPLVPATSYAFLAGGIGITPLLPMLQQAVLVGARWTLVYAGRSRHRMPYLDELVQYGDAVRLAVSDEGGRLDVEEHVASLDPSTAVYVCGPEGFVHAARNGRARRPGPLRTEAFRADVGPASSAVPFRAVLGRAGLTVQVRRDQSLLDVLEEAGVPVVSSCREGTCGTCEARVLGGAVDHRDAILSPDERRSVDVMYPCVSRAAGAEITLDV